MGRKFQKMPTPATKYFLLMRIYEFGAQLLQNDALATYISFTISS